MNREIKFRAWLLKENKMVQVDMLNHNKGYGGALEIHVDNPNFNPSKSKWEGENRPGDRYLNHSMAIHQERSGGDDFVLMQFTGLKDKNGKDIFEGDILKSNYFIGVIEMWEWMWTAKSDGDHYTFRTATHSFEVIGIFMKTRNY